MIYERDLDEAIAECQGQRNPNASTCLKLAAFYTIKQHMFGKEEPQKHFDEPVSSYSFSAGDDVIQYESGTEFGKMVSGRKASEVMPILDELIETLKIINPRLYDAAMRKLG